MSMVKLKKGVVEKPREEENSEIPCFRKTEVDDRRQYCKIFVSLCNYSGFEVKELFVDISRNVGFKSSLFVRL